MDGVPLPCMTGEGCPIPDLSETGQRIMELRGLLVSLQPTVDAGSICRMYGADLDDLKLLAIVEEELKRLQPKATKGTDDYGERH